MITRFINWLFPEPKLDPQPSDEQIQQTLTALDLLLKLDMISKKEHAAALVRVEQRTYNFPPRID